MKAMILAAGVGSRLGSLTAHRPKALLPINGIPLLEHIIKRLITFGYHKYLINIHHHGQQIIDFIDKHQGFGQDIEFSDERDALMDTGGGLKKAAGFFAGGDDFLVYNADIISNTDLNKLREFHKKQQALVSLAVRDRIATRKFLFDETMQLKAWMDCKKDGQSASPGNNLQAFAFSGIQMISPAIFPLIEEEGAFSLTTLYLRLCRDYPVMGCQLQDAYWFDAGKAEDIQSIESYLKNNPE